MDSVSYLKINWQTSMCTVDVNISSCLEHILISAVQPEDFERFYPLAFDVWRFVLY